MEQASHDQAGTKLAKGRWRKAMEVDDALPFTELKLYDVTLKA